MKRHKWKKLCPSKLTNEVGGISRAQAHYILHLSLLFDGLLTNANAQD